jgi:hypothetical protein
VTRDAANAIRVYINGVESTTGARTQSDLFSFNVLAQYNDGSYPTANWDGWIDDVRLYARCLTVSEIRTLASRRGIAYETRRQRRAYVAAGGGSTYPRNIFTGNSLEIVGAC